METQPETISITNFSGRLTRILNGDLNSGFAKFAPSWGYDPFSKPMNLTWLDSPIDIAGSVITDAVLAGQTISPTVNEEYVYAIGNSSKFYKIDPTQSGSGNNPTFDSPSVIGSTSVIASAVPAYNYGADMDYYNSTINISSDNFLHRMDTAGSIVGVASVTGSRYHPLITFQGSLYIGNGNNLMKMDTTNIIVNGAVLSPALPTGMYIQDLDTSPDGTYMIITASYLYPDQINAPTSAGRVQAYAVESYLFFWNGSDAGVTSTERLPSYPAKSLVTFLDSRYTFNQDAFGVGLYEGSQKILTLPNNLTPMPSGIAANGTYLSWVSPEGTGSPNSSSPNYTNTYTSLYYFGRLDAESPAGLWRFQRITPTVNRHAYRAPLNMLVNAFSLNLNAANGWGKHYFSVWESDGGSNTYHFYKLLLPPAASTTPVLGVYETQTQLFSKRMSVNQIRVYTEPTIANNGFQIDCIGSNGSVITNGTFTYSFVAGSDETRMQGSLERINFNPTMGPQYALGIRITNTGMVNSTIKKIEIDWNTDGK